MRDGLRLRTDYLEHLLRTYYPFHFFAVFRAHELYNVEPYIDRLCAPILDLGCGDGTVCNLLFGHPLDYGIDPSDSATQIARANGAYKTVFCADAHTIPLPDNSLGGVFSNCVLEHIPDMSGAIQEVSRVLRPGGYFVATCLSEAYYALNPVFRAFDRPLLRGLRARMIGAENRLQSHVSILSAAEYQRLFETSGMLLEEHRYYGPAPIANFCNQWDTASKYTLPFPVGLTHFGLLHTYLRLRYNRLARKETTWRRWYQRFYDMCYDRNEANTVGVGQILVARKCTRESK